MKNRKKKLVSVLLFVCMLGTTPAVAADFSDGTETVRDMIENQADFDDQTDSEPQTEEDTTDVFSSDSSEEDFTNDEVQEETSDQAAAMSNDKTDINVTIYALDPSCTVISVPSELPTSYQIPTGSGGQQTTCEVISGSTVTVSKSGLITPALHPVTYVHPDGSETQYMEHEFGNTTISVKTGSQAYHVNVTLVDYSEYYAEQRIDTFLKQNISDSMPDYDKVAIIAKWLSRNFDYSPKHSGYVGLMVYGCGDCWANTNAVNYMCKKLGIQAYTRYAANDGGAGGGHRNSVVIIDGERYLVDCGFVGNAPRAYDFQKMDYDYSYKTLRDGTLRLYQYEGLDTQITVPDTINGKKVTVLGNSTFQNCIVAKNIKSVVLPDTLTTIEKNAFYNCEALNSVTIPKNVSSIGLAAFVPDNSKSELNEIKVSPDNPYFSEKDGAVFDKSGTTLKIFPSGRSGDYQIPEGTKSIDDYAFYYCVNLNSVTIPGSVEKLGLGAFGDCADLQNITLKEGIKEIGDYAFSGDWKITSVSLPSSIEKIGLKSFAGIKDMRIKILSRNAVFDESVCSKKNLIIGFEGSTSQKYASENGISFAAMNENGEIPIQDSWFTVKTSQYTYSGEAFRPSVTLSSAAPVLKLSTDYEVNYRNNINAGKASVEITGKGIFTGKIIKNFTIAPSDYNFYNVTFAENNRYNLEVNYTGKAIIPPITPLYNMTEGKDYTVTYENNINPGRGKVTVTGIGNYSGSAVLYFNIYRKLPDPERIPDQIYTGNLVEPEVQIKGLKEGTDYTVEYDNNFDPGRAEAIITGIGNYSGSITLYFDIYCKLPTPKRISDREYTGDWIEPVIDLGYLIEDMDYTVTYENNKNPGIGKAIITGIGDYQGSVTVYFNIYCELPEVEKIPNQIYTGKEIEPSIYLEDLVEGSDYKVTYTNNLNAGIATVLVQGIGNIRGQQSVNFRIMPPVTSLKKITPNKKSLKFAWEINSQATGYQIQYSSNKSFASDRKTITLNKNYITSYKATRLKAKKVYYVRMRTYKKAGGVTLYSKWSKIGKVKTK